MAGLGYQYGVLGVPVEGGLGPAEISPYDFNFVPPIEETGAAMQPYEPSLRERVGNWIYDTAQGYGLPANRMRNEAEAAIDFVPGIGDAVGFDEANRDVAAGHPVLGGIGYGAAALGMVPMVGDALSGSVKKGIRAYHGSPHDFDRFSLDKIGTGEGAQAYGHGLYFAENEGVARSYRDALSNYDFWNGTVNGVPLTDLQRFTDPESRAAVRIAQIAEDTQQPIAAHKAAIEQVKSEIDNIKLLISDGSTSGFLKNKLDDYEAELAYLRSVPTYKNSTDLTFDLKPASKGRMYEVNIDANPEDFLDWDKPLSEQSDSVRKSLAKRGIKNEEVNGWTVMPREEYKRLLMDRYGVERITDLPPDKWAEANALGSVSAGRHRANPSGQAIIESLAGGDANYSEGATQALRDVGIPGIKYLDAGSRGAGDGSRNYVVFDDKLINIVRKYGIAGALAAGLLTREQAQAMSEQGYI